VDNVSPAIFFCRFLGAGSYTRVYVENNLQYPDDQGISVDNGVTVSHNYAGSATAFVSYTKWGGPNNNLHLTSADTTARDQGTSMATYFTTDKDGVTRPQGSAWDIGAYEYNSGTSTGTGTAVVPPTSLSATVH